MSKIRLLIMFPLLRLPELKRPKRISSYSTTFGDFSPIYHPYDLLREAVISLCMKARVGLIIHFSMSGIASSASVRRSPLRVKMKAGMTLLKSELG